MPTEIFLHGGGNNAESREETFGRFAAEAVRQPADKPALVIAEAEETAVPRPGRANPGLHTTLQGIQCDLSRSLVRCHE